MNPARMTRIAGLLMDNFIGEDPSLRFHWLLTKSCLPGCMPANRKLWRELRALARRQGRASP